MHKLLTMGVAGVLLLGAVACGDSTEPGPGTLDEPFVVSGTVQNNTPAEIPSNARVVIAWTVSSGSPDYSYVFGEGSLDAAEGTFEITLDAEPPAEALNGGVLGVGVIAVISNASVSTGDDLSDIPVDQILGAAGAYGVIYVDDGAAAGSLRGWAADFPVGYAVGAGGPEEDGFETFVPVDADGVELIIDDLDNISFVNWT